jgi:uncharacterized protein
MEELISYQSKLLHQIDNDWQRYLFPELKKGVRLLGIKGLRGVGKTTMFLQYLAFEYEERKNGLYVTADHPYFYRNSLFELASEWSGYGGKLLLIDEVHKYPNWSRELKLIYDGHPDLKVYFTSSSALDLYRGESDLSRRLLTHTLHGLSFREFLLFRHGISFQRFDLTEIINKHVQITAELTRNIKILPLFQEYLVDGYFPFSRDIEPETFIPRLIQLINTVLESDLASIEGYSASNVRKIKRLLGVIAETAPFEPNISKIAEKLQLGRNTVNDYLKNLHDAQVLQLLRKPAKGNAQLQKPDKIYFENTSLAYAFQNSPEKGTIRETFFMNQLKNAGYLVEISPTRSDFLVDRQYTFEVGGKNKDQKQIKNIEQSYMAIDAIEYGFAETIPLWLFGLMY